MADTNIIPMKRSDALSWVKLAIEREMYGVALEILTSMIDQEKKIEEKQEV